MALGNMDEQNYIMENGILLSMFESGPWLGFKFSNNSKWAWIGGGTKSYDFMVCNNFSQNDDKDYKICSLNPNQFSQRQKCL